MSRLTAALRERHGYTAKEAAIVVECMAETLKDLVLERGEAVQVPGFGTFRPKRVKQRVYRNPKTGAERVLPARTLVSFRPYRSK